MPALAADVAKYTNDGVLLRAPDMVTSAAIKALHPGARTVGTAEIEMFFRNPDHGQAMLNEKAGYLTIIGPAHEGIEVEASLGLGSVIPIAPTVPSFQCIDDERGLNKSLRTRAYAHDLSSDRYSVEELE